MSLPQQVPEMPTGWAQTALAAMGIATICTDTTGRVRLMNGVAESLTGWRQSEAEGQLLANIYSIENEVTGRSVTNPVTEILTYGITIGLSDHTILINRDGKRCRIDHGAASIRDSAETLVGAVLIFCDVSERERIEQAVEEARAYADGIVQTVREPLVVLDTGLRVKTANQSFYKKFRVTPAETEGQSFFELGNLSWNIPVLRRLLEEILPHHSHFDDFEVVHDFEGLGRRSMVLNARRLCPSDQSRELILLSIEDATQRRQTDEDLAVSETRYRRLFETAQDGILLVDPQTRLIFDANPFLTDLLGYSQNELVGKELWEIGLFRDIDSNKAAFYRLQDKGYIRYDDLPLRTHDDREIQVEFVSNVYDVGTTQVIQCNIRDVTDRKRAQDALQAAHLGLELRVEERTAELAESNASLKDEIVKRKTAEADRRDLQQQLTTVQEDERRRIARELHDQMGQHLTALGLGLKVVKDATPDPSPARESLKNLLSMTDVIGREIHQLALELRPTALDDLGLNAALANYAEGWSERSGIEIDFHHSGSESQRLPAPIETALYRVIQEALTNVLKHACAKRVSIVLRRTPGQVSALVEDDGEGFDTDSVPRHRLGILGMQERVALVGGTLVVESGPSPGTIVIARIPIPGEEGGGQNE